MVRFVFLGNILFLLIDVHQNKNQKGEECKVSHRFSVYYDINPDTQVYYVTTATGSYIVKVERLFDGIFVEERSFQASGHDGIITRLRPKTNYRFGVYSNGHWVYATHTTR